MVNAEARFKEVYITPEGESVTHTYVIPDKVFYYIEKLEQSLKESEIKANKLEDVVRTDELEIAQRVILNLRSDKGGTGYCCLSDPERSVIIGSDYWNECATRIIRALRHLDVRGNRLSKDRVGGLDAEEAEKLKEGC